MKPRTKKEKLLVEYSAKLPSLTEAQRNYPKEHIFKKKGLYMKKGLVWCQYCGHEYKVNTSSLAVSLDVGGEICPCCGKELRLEHYTGKHNDEGVCYIVVTTYKGFQVLRCFDTTRNNTRGKATTYTLNEMFQLWIDEKGRETILTRRYSRSYYHLSFKYDEPFTIGHHNGSTTGCYSYSDLFDITDCPCYNRISVIPILRRNGWSNSFVNLRGVDAAVLMQSLIKNNDIEMLAKTGQHDIMRYWIGRGWHESQDRQYDFFDSVKIANRNHYIVKDASMWYDMLDALTFLHLDTHNAHYVCPDDLKAAHDNFVGKMQRIKAKMEEERIRKKTAFDESNYNKQKGRYLGICFGNEHIRITVLQHVSDFYEEGKQMHHCVFTNRYYEKKDSLVLSAKDENDNRLATIELSLRNYRVLQCRAKCNQKPELYDEIVSIVESHRDDFAKAKRIKKLKAKELCKQ